MYYSFNTPFIFILIISIITVYGSWSSDTKKTHGNMIYMAGFTSTCTFTITIHYDVHDNSAFSSDISNFLWIYVFRNKRKPLK